MKNFITLFLFVIPFVGFCQVEIYAGGNVSVMPELVERVGTNSVSLTSGFATIDRAYTVRDNFQSRYGFEVGVRYRKSLSDRLDLVSGVNLSSISYQRESEIIYDDSDLGSSFFGEIITSDGQPLTGRLIGGSSSLVIEQTENVGKTNLKYLSVPLALEYKLFEKLGVSFGFQSSCLIHSSEVINQYTVSTNGFVIVGDDDPIILFEDSDGLLVDSAFELVEEKDKSGSGYNNYTFLAQFGINYDLFKKINLTTRFSQGLNSIYSSEKEYAGSVKARTIALGVTYLF